MIDNYINEFPQTKHFPFTDIVEELCRLCYIQLDFFFASMQVCNWIYYNKILKYYRLYLIYCYQIFRIYSLRYLYACGLFSFLLIYFRNSLFCLYQHRLLKPSVNTINVIGNILVKVPKNSRIIVLKVSFYMVQTRIF